MPITINDVALLAGVSRSTVSKVINDSSRISERTKEKVRAVMAELNYHPNQIARGFAHQRSYNIGVLMVLEQFCAFNNPYIFEILCGVESICNKQNYNVSLINLRNADEKMARFAQIVAEKRVDGFLLHASPEAEPLAKLLQEKKIPFVMIGRPSYSNTMNWVDIDNHHAGALAAEHLLQQNYHYPAFIGSSAHDTITMQRLDGFRSVLTQQPPEVQLGTGSSQDEGFRLAQRLSESAVRLPDAIVVSDNLLASGVMRWAHEQRLVIPQQLAVISFDNHPLSQVSSPSLSVVDVDLFELGAAAARILFNALEQPDIHQQVKLSNAKTLARESSTPRTS